MDVSKLLTGDRGIRSMKGLFFIGLSVTVFIVSGVLLTLFTVKDSAGIGIDRKTCALRETSQLLHNPIERLIIVKTVVEGRRGRTVYTGSYTLFGLRYAVVKAVCGGSAEATWRRWFDRERSGQWKD